MVRSMTGFGMGDAESDDYRFHLEVKAVNHRYLDIDIRLPFILNRFDAAIRQKIKDYVARGKFSVSVAFFDKREKERAVAADLKLAKAYRSTLDALADALEMPHPKDVMSLARMSDAITVDEAADEMDGCEEILLNALESALAKLVSMREKEGANIKDDFKSRLAFIAEATSRLEEIAPRQVEHYRERLLKVIADLGVATGSPEIEARIVQEVALYADRIDYTEEFVRLKSHIGQFHKIIEESTPIGRKLDFLVQEMNREINTATSKSPDIEVANLAVAVKSEIEKLREQIQNVE